MPDPTDPFAQPGARRLVIFGHPAHELALYGLLQRHPPDAILMITDGGGPHREQNSRDGLEAIGLLDRAEYLHYPEDRFYEALLERDSDFFLEIVSVLRDRIARHRPHQVFCDAVEFYNPVHDITLPIVRAAAAGITDAPIYEIPLVYQETGPGESYRIQRVPPELSERRISHDLTETETTSKVHARDNIYTNLREQAGPEFMDLSPAHLAIEEVFAAGKSIPEPDSTGRALRYDRRAKLLKAEGAIDRVITHDDHFIPVVREIAACEFSARVPQ